MHISEQVKSTLIEMGFTMRNTDDLGDTYYVRQVETGGQYGIANQTVRIDRTGRWLERVNGWVEVEGEAHLREFDDAQSAIARVLA